MMAIDFLGISLLCLGVVCKTCFLSLFQIGGAFAPPLKDLSRFLQENPEYGIPPEWADVVKQSVSKERNIFHSR